MEISVQTQTRIFIRIQIESNRKKN